MKNYIHIILLLLCGSMFTTVNAQSVPKVEKTDIFVPILTVKDSLFLHGLDSLIFNSICSEIKETNNLKIFNVYCKKINQQENSFELTIWLDMKVHIYNEKDIKGCFDYNGYTFLWFYNVPPTLFSLSNQKKKLTYFKNEIMATSDHAEFAFNYTEGVLRLTGICCY